MKRWNEKLHIVPTEEERKEDKAFIFSQIVPIARACLLSVPLVFGINVLIESWGGTMPSAAWGVPLVMCACFYLLLFANYATPKKIVFTSTKLRDQGFYTDTVRWASVRNWHLDEMNGVAVATFFLTWNRKKTIPFYKSVTVGEVRFLIEKYGNI